MGELHLLPEMRAGFFFSRIFFVGKTGKIPNRELWNGLGFKGFKGLKSHPIPIPWAGVIPVKPHSNGAWENSRESGNSFPKSHLNFPFSTWNCVLPSQFPMKTFRISPQRIGNVPAWCQSPGKAGKFHFPSPVIDFLLLENRDNTGFKMGMKMKFFLVIPEIGMGMILNQPDPTLFHGKKEQEYLWLLQQDSFGEICDP